MLYRELAEYYEKLEKTPSKLAKAHILAEILSKVPMQLLPMVTLLFRGRVYPSYSEQELGIATQMMIRAIAKASGFSADDVEKILKKIGDLGLVAEQCVKSKKQSSLLRKKLTVEHVAGNLKTLATIAGEGSQDKKLSLIAELIISAHPNEARYIVRTILGELRIGVAEGIIKDAIVEAFLTDEKSTKEEKDEAGEAVEYAWSVLSDFSEVAQIAKQKGIKGLKNVRIHIGRPIQVMLGLAADKPEDVIKEFGKVIAQFKYDGIRVVIEKKKDKFWIFTRRQEDVTKQFPDIVEMAAKYLKADECIVEGEALGIDKKTNSPVPFQILGQRIQRKYDIEKMAREIPVQVNLFDVIYLDGEIFLDKPLMERLEILGKITRPVAGKFQIAKQIVTDDVKKLDEFYKKALDENQEGIMLKIPDSTYVFGRHVGMMYKIKPIMETLDLAITGATWGEGTRANWLTSYIISCKDPKTGKLLECGMMSTGLSEDQYGDMTKKLKPLITSEKGRTVYVKPKIIVEVGYQEIQKSTNYSSGYALRFPRFLKLRFDKSEPDDLDRIVSLFKSKGRVG